MSDLNSQVIVIQENDGKTNELTDETNDTVDDEIIDSTRQCCACKCVIQ